jgi:hypothetical protein
VIGHLQPALPSRGPSISAWQFELTFQLAKDPIAMTLSETQRLFELGQELQRVIDRMPIRSESNYAPLLVSNTLLVLGDVTLCLGQMFRFLSH